MILVIELLPSYHNNVYFAGNQNIGIYRCCDFCLGKFVFCLPQLNLYALFTL